MIEFNHIIKDELGIHARPAGLLVKHAVKYSSSVNISVNGKVGDAKKVFSVLGLCVKQNDEIAVRIEGEDEGIASIELKKFLEENL